MENKNAENQNSLITRTTPQITVFFETLDRMLDKVEVLAKKSKPTLNGDRYLTDKELSERLKIVEGLYRITGERARYLTIKLGQKFYIRNLILKKC